LKKESFKNQTALSTIKYYIHISNYIS